MLSLNLGRKLEKHGPLQGANILPVGQRGHGVGEFVSQGEMKKMTLKGLRGGNPGNVIKKLLLLGLLVQLLIHLEYEGLQKGLDLHLMNLSLHLTVSGVELGKALGHHPLPPLELHPVRLLRNGPEASLVVVVKEVARDNVFTGLRLDNHSLLQLIHETDRVLNSPGLFALAKKASSNDRDDGCEHNAMVIWRQATRKKSALLSPGLQRAGFGFKINFCET